MNKFITFAYLTTKWIAIFLFVVIIFSQCTSPENKTEENADYKQELSSTLWKISDVDSLAIHLKNFIAQKDEIGKMLTYKVIGVRQRENARFSDAIYNHQKVWT